MSVIKTKPCKVFLPYGECNPIECGLLKILLIIQGIQISANFKVWIWCEYDIILGMLWFNDVDASIACKHGELHGKKIDGKPLKSSINEVNLE